MYMRKFALITALLFTTICNAQLLKEIFKYSTLYGSYTESSPLFVPDSYFVTQGGEVINTTPEVTNDFSYSFGIRKIARFGYENKENRFYDGSEQNSSLNSNFGNVKGLEYLVQYTKGKQRGREFESERYFLRYSRKWWSTKLEIQKNGIINLNYKSADLRLKIPIGNKFNLSIGGIVRTHKPYGFNPIANYLETSPWWDLAYEYGYYDIYYGIDYDNDGQLDNFDWYWVNENGDRVADTDLDFRRNIYQDIVNDYNQTQLNNIGTLATLSIIAGSDFYYYRDNFWLHTWANILPKHKHISGDQIYSYKNYTGSDDWVDYNYGVMFGWFITKKIGLFTEIEQTRFWDKNLQFIKAGVNIQI